VLLASSKMLQKMVSLARLQQLVAQTRQNVQPLPAL
jgi:hypothetical protein